MSWQLTKCCLLSWEDSLQEGATCWLFLDAVSLDVGPMSFQVASSAAALSTALSSSAGPDENSENALPEEILVRDAELSGRPFKLNLKWPPTLSTINSSAAMLPKIPASCRYPGRLAGIQSSQPEPDDLRMEGRSARRCGWPNVVKIYTSTMQGVGPCRCPAALSPY